MSEYRSELGRVRLANGQKATITATGGGYSTAYIDGFGKVTIPVTEVRGRLTSREDDD